MANKKTKKKISKNAGKKSPAKKVITKVAKKAAKTVTKKAPPKKAPKKAAKKPAQKQVKKPAKAAVKKSAVPFKAKLIPVKTAKPIKLTDYSKAFTPLADRLVVRVAETEKVTAGGIIIPDSASAASGYLKGEVLAVGNGAKNKKGNIKPLDVKLGDFVLFAQYSGTKIEFNTEELQIVKESDVMGIVQK